MLQALDTKLRQMFRNSKYCSRLSCGIPLMARTSLLWKTNISTCVSALAPLAVSTWRLIFGICEQPKIWTQSLIFT
jgi:hypothetical protein